MKSLIKEGSSTIEKVYVFSIVNNYIGLKGREAALIKAEFRYPVYTCTVADYFCQGMQLKKFGHFYRASAFKNAISVLMFGTRLFSALVD